MSSPDEMKAVNALRFLSIDMIPLQSPPEWTVLSL